MTYKVGQKVLVEATVVSSDVDRDGDIKIAFNEHGDWEYVREGIVREISAEPSPIAFEDLKVGDKIRATKDVERCGSTYSQAYEFVVELVGTDSVHGAGLYFASNGSFTFELISRPAAAVKLGDRVSIDQVKTLPIGSVVESGLTRVVTPYGLYNPLQGEAYSWDTYTSNLHEFVVVYIPKQPKDSGPEAS